MESTKLIGGSKGRKMTTPEIENAVLLKHGAQAHVRVFRLMQIEGVDDPSKKVPFYWLALRLPGEREARLLGRRRTVDELLPLLEKGSR